MTDLVEDSVACLEAGDLRKHNVATSFCEGTLVCSLVVVVGLFLLLMIVA